MDSDLDQRTLTTAREAGLVACRSCGLVSRASSVRCSRCGETIESRDVQSLQRVWAYMVAGLIAYVPANLYPILITTQLFQTTDSTIVGGVVDLIHHHAYAIAAIVFIASVIIPVGKFLVIGYLAWILSRPHTKSPHRLHLLYEAVEFIGRWSMIDVFVVAILAALVQFGVVATIKPGLAAVCFAISVVFTMLSAQAFDPRLIWDRATIKGHHDRH